MRDSLYCGSKMQVMVWFQVFDEFVNVRLRSSLEAAPAEALGDGAEQSMLSPGSCKFEPSLRY